MLVAACCLPCSECAPPECYESVKLLHLHLAVLCARRRTAWRRCLCPVQPEPTQSGRSLHGGGGGAGGSRSTVTPRDLKAPVQAARRLPHLRARPTPAQVLFLSVREDGGLAALRDVAAAAREAMERGGLQVGGFGGGGAFALHVTVAKLSKLPRQRRGMRRIPREAYAACTGISGGAVPLPTVQLCRMGVPPPSACTPVQCAPRSAKHSALWWSMQAVGASRRRRVRFVLRLLLLLSLPRPSRDAQSSHSL